VPEKDEKSCLVSDVVHPEDDISSPSRLQTKELEEVNLIKELFIDMITHDVKNQVSPMVGLSEILLEEYPKNKIIAAIHRSSTQTIKLIENAAVLSQVLQRENIQMEMISISDMIRSIMSEFEDYAKNYGVTISNEVPDDIRIASNPILRQIFTHYMEHALRYAKDGKRIVVSANTTDQELIVKVTDFGETILPEERERVFKRMVRLEGCNLNGTGKGLSVVKRIAEAHNGEVWVEPNLPRGNCFCLKLQM